MKSITVWGAYGRDYNSTNAAFKAWRAGLDFQSNSGYITEDEAKRAGYKQVTIRYAKLTKSVVVKL
jgi:hypothetical protein